MSKPTKIEPQHLEREAYVYIRQSTPHQVEVHLESQDLQYQLGQRAQSLGWRAEQVVIIDDDLGKSAISTTDRPGFQNLVAAVGLAQVGIILVTDVSRLARNCADWYQLLDLSSVYGTLIGDGSSIYDPQDYNDRLLLGLKGTFSEAQWYSMRSQLYQALMNKAQRGELAIRLPVGYERLEDGAVVFSPDQEVQAAIRLVFAQFECLGSARAVLLYCVEHDLALPRQLQRRPDRGKIDWVKASYQAIYRILTHPAYAGAYTFGKTYNVRLPGQAHKVVNRQRPLAEWPVLIQDAFPAYISWEHYLQNREQLRQNDQQAEWRKGAARSGSALLQGIVICGRCGRPLRLRYSNQPAYLCAEANRQYGEPRCQNFMAPHIDAAVSQVFLQAVQPAHLAAALAALEQVEEQRQSLLARWRQRLERARYEAELARRRYEQVDPDHRLVATELERQWEAKLQAWQQLEQQWVRAQQQEVAPLSEADRALIERLASDLPALWQAETTGLADRKRLLRCLIADVTLDADTQPGFSLIHIRWQTGATTVAAAERPRTGCRTSADVVAQIRELAQHQPDDQIARLLNEAGSPTATAKTWTERRVAHVRKHYDIPTACPYFTQTPGPRGDGLISAGEAADQLGVTPSMIAFWFRRGLLVGHQRRRQAALWVRLNDDDRQRLDGSSILEPEMDPLPEVMQTLNLTTAQLRAEIETGHWLPYRLRVNNRWRWYMLRRDNDG
jgi:DNA invertase Pin-like site-specific DNA recombinase